MCATCTSPSSLSLSVLASLRMCIAPLNPGDLVLGPESPSIEHDEESEKTQCSPFGCRVLLSVGWRYHGVFGGCIYMHPHPRTWWQRCSRRMCTRVPGCIVMIPDASCLVRVIVVNNRLPGRSSTREHIYSSGNSKGFASVSCTRSTAVPSFPGRLPGPRPAKVHPMGMQGCRCKSLKRPCAS